MSENFKHNEFQIFISEERLDFLMEKKCCFMKRGFEGYKHFIESGPVAKLLTLKMLIQLRGLMRSY